MRTRIIGIVMIVVSLGVDAWLAAGTAEAVRQNRSITGHILGFVLFSLPFLAVGLYLLLASRGEVKAETTADKQRTILNAVMTRGRVSVADMAIECQVSREQVKVLIYDIIGKDLFRGYVNWERGELVSAEAAQIKDHTCPNCGGKVELAGKGLVKCPYCGTETYLSAPAASEKPPAPPPEPAEPPADATKPPPEPPADAMEPPPAGQEAAPPPSGDGA
jgi:hypothetical protein